MGSQASTPAEFILAVALFDANGFPQDHFITEAGFRTSDFKLNSWVQGIFQALGLQSLLTTSLQLEGSRFFVTRNLQGMTVGIRRHTGYLATMFAPEIKLPPQDLIPWLYDFEPEVIRPAPTHRRVIPLKSDSAKSSS